MNWLRCPMANFDWQATFSMQMSRIIATMATSCQVCVGVSVKETAVGVMLHQTAKLDVSWFVTISVNVQKLIIIWPNVLNISSLWFTTSSFSRQTFSSRESRDRVWVEHDINLWLLQWLRNCRGRWGGMCFCRRSCQLERTKSRVQT